ncbi:MAG: ferrochelatase [Oligoflexales bacterium]
MHKRKSLLLLNLGTPDSTSTADVRRYLKEFLSDPRVLDIPKLLRWFLLHCIILPFRPKKSAEAYSQIWTDEGSPLLVYTKKLAEKIQPHMKDTRVYYAMRYQNPSIKSTLQNIQKDGCDSLTILPLFPQYSSAANGSAIEKVFQELSTQWNIPDIKVRHDFYEHPGFIKAFAEIGRSHLNSFKPDKIMFSFHGLPERHCRKSDESPNKDYCFSNTNCCDTITKSNRRCYRAQCYATARALAKELNLTEKDWEVSFQSRLGRTPWIQPYTDNRLSDLPKENVKKLAVYCPSFVADCLETLEEIEIRAKADFISHGGTDLILIPSLNINDTWIQAVKEIASDIE